MPTTRRGPLGLSRFVLVAGFLTAFAACLAPISSPDLPWHISSGRQILEQREIPSRDFLSWTRAGRPWIDFEWGTDVLYAVLDATAGAKALWGFKAAAFSLLLVLFAAFLRAGGLPDSWIGLALPPFLLSVAPVPDLRPEIASYCLCLAQLHLLEARRTGRLRLDGPKLLTLQAGLYALWASLHPGFAVGLILCLIYAAGEGDAAFLRLAAAGFLGTLVNPYGLKLYEIFWIHWTQGAVLRAYVIPWSKPLLWDDGHRCFLSVLLFSAGAFLSCAASPRKPPRAHLLALLVFGLLGLQFERQTSYVALIVFPLALQAAYSLDLTGWRRRLRPWALACIFAALAPPAAGTLRRAGLFKRIDDTQETKLSGTAAFLKLNGAILSPLRMYCSWNTGAYLGYALSADYKVFMDGRYLFTGYFPLVAQASLTPDAWQRFMADQRIELSVRELSGIVARNPAPASSPWRPIETYYMPRPEWAVVYRDDHAAVWVKRSAVPASWLEGREIQL